MLRFLFPKCHRNCLFVNAFSPKIVCLVGFHINFAYFPYYIKHIIGPAGDKLRSVAALKETFISDVHAIFYLWSSLLYSI